MRSLVRPVAAIAALLPLHAAHALAHARRWVAAALAGPRAKAITLGTLLVGAVLAAATGHAVVEIVVVLLLVGVVGSWTAAVLERPMGIRRLARRAFPLDGIAPARVTLRLLGFDDTAVESIAAEVDAGQEVRIAAFDQQNRLLSDFGPIPYFGNELINGAQFIQRHRHRLELVAAFGVVAIRKAYQGRISLGNEALALAALSRLDGVPRIVHLDRRAGVMYQSFVSGQNLGSLTAARGASVAVQHEVATGRPEPGTWTEATATSAVRRKALRVLAEVAPTGCVDQLGRMLVRVHEAGVTLGDVKFGNVLLQNGMPALCDFDWARVIDRSGITALDRREEERDIFNYSFGAALPTMAGARRELHAIALLRPDLAAAAVDFGGGFRFGHRWSLDAGSGRWRAMRGYLPVLKGRRIVDLGSWDVIVLLELLRAGAARVTTYQCDAVAARFARACHGLVEHIDNRRYDFEVVESATPRVHAGDDLATAFGAFDGLAVREVDARLGALTAEVQQVVLQVERQRDARDVGVVEVPVPELLRRHGFGLQRSVTPWCTAQSLDIATRS